jgi:hypothetical protein
MHTNGHTGRGVCTVSQIGYQFRVRDVHHLPAHRPRNRG